MIQVIPAAAKEFVFSYPVVSWDAMSGGSDDVRSFLSVGGYAYLNATRQIIHTTTLLPTSCSPLRWGDGQTSTAPRRGRR